MSWAHITPEAREKSLQKLRACWADPEYRARHVERLRAQARTAHLGKGFAPEVREKFRQQALARWSDPEYRESQIARLRAQAPKASRAPRTRRVKLSAEELRLRRKVRHELWLARRDAQAKRDAEGPPA